MIDSQRDPAGFWNARFDAASEVYGAAPNAWLVECEPVLPRSARVLSLAEGQGRNALWLARQGHAVQALDISAVAMGQLQVQAERHGLAVSTRALDLADWSPEPESFDAVLLVFAHFPPDLRAVVHAKAAASLKPGAVLILEGFAREQLGRPSGGPRECAWLFDEATLRADFQRLQLQRLQQIDAPLDEGPLHQGAAVRWRLLARRPET